MAVTLTTKFFIVSSLLLVLISFDVSKAQPIVSGLSWSFYESKCPNLESIVRNRLRNVYKDDVGDAAGILRLHFHDCFVQGCDGSVLLNGSASGPSEKSAIPNLTLRARAFKIIEDLRHRVHSECGKVVSCSDLVALAARDAVVLTGGPNYQVPLGRKDGLSFATEAATLANLVGPNANTTTVLDKLKLKNLDATDAVALSGAHTIGIGHCSSFTDRLYPNQDATMDKTFANNLKKVCPAAATTDATTDMDIRSPNTFDNKYFVDLMNRQGLFTSDQDLYTDRRTRGIVTSFAVNQTLFFEKFVVAMVKMGQLNVVTGSGGEIREKCGLRNKDKSVISTVVEEGPGFSQF